MNLKIKPVNEVVRKMYENHSHFHQGDSGLDLYIIDISCLKSLKDKIREVHTGNSNINIFLNTNNNLVKVTLNENIKINDFFINNISTMPFLEKILLK